MYGLTFKRSEKTKLKNKLTFGFMKYLGYILYSAKLTFRVFSLAQQFIRNERR